MVILVAEDEVALRRSLEVVLAEKHEVLTAEDGKKAFDILKERAVDVVLTDIQMPGMTGLELFRKGKKLQPRAAFLLMTAFGSVDQAVEAVRLGADDYLMKPFDLDELKHRLRRIEEHRVWEAETALRGETAAAHHTLIGTSPNIAQAREFIQKVAPAQAPVLILGPSGTGKEVMAKSIHAASPRANYPFIAINCASLSETLMESELFGHEKGAFTGANALKPGKFELANGGAIFLDEIGELSPALQARLLRVLQEREFYRVGGVRVVKCDARVIAATHRNLKKMVAKGTFREDLYFRLTVLTYHLEPLTKRREDLPLLIQYFWSKLTKKCGKQLTLAPETVAALCAYSFPGNVRELQNLLE